MRLAVVGKGGSGKSFVTGTLARVLARRGLKVIVLDSDPMPGVAISLGLGAIEHDMLADAVERGADGRWRLKKGIGAATAIHRFAVTGPDGIRFLQFGKPDEDGLGPIMGSVNGFARMVHRLASDGVLKDWTILGDLPAGPRQAAYDWAPYASRFLVVVEPTWQSILTARRVARIATKRSSANAIVIANKVAGDQDVVFIGERLAMDPLVAIPRDSAVVAADARGLAPFDDAPDSAAVKAVAELAHRLEAEHLEDAAG